MKSLVAALGTALLVTVGAFYGLVHLVGLDRNNAAQIAVATIGAVPYIREILKRIFPIRQNSNRAPVVPLGSYGLPPLRMILYGTLVVVGGMCFASGLAGEVANILELRVSQRGYLGSLGGIVVGSQPSRRNTAAASTRRLNRTTCAPGGSSASAQFRLSSMHRIRLGRRALLYRASFRLT